MDKARPIVEEFLKNSGWGEHRHPQVIRTWKVERIC
jgi:hypothetical protein